jgi:hypothetical protein
MPNYISTHATPKNNMNIHMKGDKISKLENAKKIPDLVGWGTTIFF